MKRWGWIRAAGLAGGTAAVAVLIAACGSDNTVGTTGAATGGTTGALVGQLSSSCQGSEDSEMSIASGAKGAASPDEAVHAFVVGSDQLARGVHGLTFEPAAPPPPMSPPQSVGAGATVGQTDSVPPGGAGETTVATYSPSPTLVAPVSKWYAHRDDTGRVTAVLQVDQIDQTWIVDRVEQCSTSAQAVTATTDATYHPPPASTTSIEATSPAGSMRGP